MNRKIHFNKIPVSSARIAEERDFAALLKAYNKAAVSPYAASGTSAGSLVGVVKIGIITTIVLLGSLLAVFVLGKKKENKEVLIEKKKETALSFLPENSTAVKHNTQTNFMADNKEPALAEKDTGVLSDKVEKNKPQKKWFFYEKVSFQKDPMSNSLLAKQESFTESRKKNDGKKIRIDRKMGKEDDRISSGSGENYIVNNRRVKKNFASILSGKNETTEIVSNERISNIPDKGKELPIADTLFGKNTVSENETITANVEVLQRKAFFLKQQFPEEIGRIEERLADIPTLDNSKRRDFEPRITLGLKTSGYVGMEKLFGRQPVWSGPFFQEKFYTYTTEEHLNSYLKYYNDTATGYARAGVRAMDIGLTGSLRMIGRCYLEVDFEYAQTNWRQERVYWDTIENRRITERLGKEHLRNLQTNMGISYWFGKSNFEYGISSGVCLRYAGRFADSSYYFQQDYWTGNDIVPSGYQLWNENKLGIAGYTQLCFRYNLPKVQLRADLGVPTNWYTSRISFSVSYKFYRLKNKSKKVMH